MQTKTAIKTITLYDFVSKNEIFIIATIYHMFILAFNHYAIKDLQRLEIEFSNHKKDFNLIESNLQFCQVITLFTTFGIFYIKDISIKFKNDDSKLFFMFISSFIKMSHMFLKIYNNGGKNFLLTSHEDEQKFGGFYILIELSYNIRLIVLGVPPLFVFMVLLVGLEMLFGKIKEWSKTYRIQYTETSLINSHEEA